MTTLANTETATRKIRTLIVDEQLIQREVLRRMLKNEADIEIIGTPANGREAVASINALNRGASKKQFPTSTSHAT